MKESDSINELHKILRSGRRYKIGKKQILQTSADRQVINLVDKGFIKRYMITSDGTIGVQITYGPRDVFPLTIVYKTLFGQSLYDGPEIFHYEAMTDAEVYTIDHTTLLEEVKKNADLYAFLLQEAGKHLKSCVHSLENLALKNSYRRVAHQLVFFAREFGQPRGSYIVLSVPLTHEDIANILGTTRETISTCMIQLRKKGLIKSDKKIIIPSLSKLENEAYG